MLNHIRACAFLTAMLAGASALADDVEIYFNYSDGSAGVPLVMFSLDYRPNLGSNICNVSTTGDDDDAVEDKFDLSSCAWTASFPEFNGFFDESELADGSVEFFDLLRTALRYVFADPLFNDSDIHVGLMLNHDNVNNCEGPSNSTSSGCSNGGYIAVGLDAIKDGADDKLGEKLLAIPPTQGNVSHSFQGKELYFELFRYLTGQGIYNGHVGHTDYGDSCRDDNLDDAGAVNCRNSDDDYPDAAWDSTIESGSNYVSPLTSAFECSSLHVINFMFAVSNQDADSDDAIEASKSDGGLDISLAGGRGEFTQVIRELRSLDLGDGTWGTIPDLEGVQNVTSHFVFNGQGSNTFNSYALAGGGFAIEVADDPRQLVDQFLNLFKEILRQNSTFEAPAVTVNSYNRLAHRDELFYALFGPELVKDWPGNLKKYKMGEIAIDDDEDGITDRTVVAIVDQQNDPAITPQGLFAVGSCSFWSTCDDGDEVDEGGAANELTASRNVFTYVGASVPSGGVDLSTNNDLHETNDDITALMLGLEDQDGNALVGDYDGDGSVGDTDDVSAAREDMLQIGRGVSDSDQTALTTIGDPIHSRPAVIVYDGDVSDADNDGVIEPDLAVAMTTNEGYFHLFNAEDGSELFSFMPKEMLPLLWNTNRKTAVDPEAGINRFNAYGLDNSVVVLWQDGNGDDVIEADNGDANSEDRVVVFLSQRRGGRNIYALDLTDKTDPKLLWHIEGGVPNSPFEELGQTWSTPTLSKMQDGIDGNGKPIVKDVLVFGGGYDEDYDRDGTQDPGDGVNMGRAVYVVEALTGNKRFEIVDSSGTTDSGTLAILTDSVPAQVQVLDLYDDGIMDRLYFSDVVGRVFRVDFDNSGTTTSLYGGGVVATLGDAAEIARDCTDETELQCRLFYNSLDVAVMTGFPRSPYIQLAMGSGFRAHPKNTTIQDRFYVVYDEKVLNLIDTDDYGSEYGYSESDLANVSTIASGTYDTVSSDLTAILTDASKHGWYVNMNQSLGEKVLSESVTVGGQVFFTTYAPIQVGATNVCAPNLGEGRIYLVNAFNGLPEATLGGDTLVDYDDINLLDKTDNPSETNRWQLLPRQGMPTDPTIVFKEKSDGTIEPNLIVGTLMPLPADLIKANPVRATWWVEE